MKPLTLALSALLGVVACATPSLAQDKGKKDGKARQKAEEQAEKRRALLEEVRPSADWYASAMLMRNYPDALVQGHVTSLGQRLVPDEVPASTTFSFRVYESIVPGASALPDGRIYISTGMLAHVENEAQLAMVLGHEIAHVLKEHALERLRRQRSGQKRNQVIGAAAGAALGGLLGGKKGGAGAAAGGATAGMALGLMTARLVSSVLRSKYSKEAEREADVLGTELALAQGFDPEEAVRFWERQDERFRGRSLRPEAGDSLFGTHPSERVRAESLRVVLDGELKPKIEERRAGGPLTQGTERFGSVLSALMRDTGSLMAERSDRHDLAVRLLEKARQHRPNDPRLLWALGRTYLLIARDKDKQAEANTLLTAAAEQDRRRIFPAIHRDLAYAVASRSGDYAAALEHLKAYVNGHVTVHGQLPADIDEVYDNMVLFGDNSWTPGPPEETSTPQTILVADGPGPQQSQLRRRYHPTVWATPGNVAAYDRALHASAQQIENSFGAALVQGADDSGK